MNEQRERERERERADKGLTGQATSVAFIQPLVLQTTRTKNGRNMIIMPQSLKQWNFCLQRKIFHLSFVKSACGEGHLSKVLEEHGFEVISTDLIYRGFGDPEPLDFLKDTLEDFEGDIITNPPYKYALEFVQKALDSVQPGKKVAMFLKLQFLEGKSRKQFFLHNPPKVVYVSSSRLICAMNGEFEKYPSSAVAYAWFVWEKGFKGDPIIKWIN